LLPPGAASSHRFVPAAVLRETLALRPSRAAAAADPRRTAPCDAAQRGQEPSVPAAVAARSPLTPPRAGAGLVLSFSLSLALRGGSSSTRHPATSGPCAHVVDLGSSLIAPVCSSLLAFVGVSSDGDFVPVAALYGSSVTISFRIGTPTVACPVCWIVDDKSNNHLFADIFRAGIAEAI